MRSRPTHARASSRRKSLKKLFAVVRPIQLRFFDFLMSKARNHFATANFSSAAGYAKSASLLRATRPEPVVLSVNAHLLAGDIERAVSMAASLIQRGAPATLTLLDGTFEALRHRNSELWDALWTRLTQAEDWNRLATADREALAERFLDCGALNLGVGALRGISPRSPEGTLHLAKALFADGSFQDMFELLVFEGDGLAPTMKASLLAQANLSLQRPVRAHWWLHQLTSSEVDPSELLAVAELAFAAGFRNIGVKTLRSALEGSPSEAMKSTQMLGEGVRLCIAHKESGLATALATRLKEVQPHSPWSSIWLGRALRLAGDLDGAWSEHESAVGLAPRLPTAWAELTRTLEARGGPNERLRDIATHLLDMEPEDEWPRQVALAALAGLNGTNEQETGPPEKLGEAAQADYAPVEPPARSPSKWAALERAIELGDYGAASELERQLAAPWDVGIARTMATWHRRRGELSRAMEVLDKVTSAQSEVTAGLRQRVEADLRGLWADPHRPIRRVGHLSSVRGRVLHLVGKSVPYVLSGYTVRTRYTVEAQRGAGIESFVMTEPGFPWSVGEDTAPLVEVVGDVPYLRVPSIEPTDGLGRMTAIVRWLRPAALHAHSDFRNAQRALALGRAFDLPVIYEVRGIWEETWVSKRGEDHRAAEYYRLRRERETEAMMAVDHVIVLNEQIKADILSRGVPTDRISVVPNAVDADKFPVLRRDEPLAERWGISRVGVTVGYISSLVPYEGVDCLVRAISHLASEGLRVRTLVVGEGESRDELESLARELGIDDLVTFTGRIPHEEILSYYSLIDIFVIPRTADRVSRLVTPLKPFEAMATGRAVVVSGVEALREIIEEGVTGLSYEPENPVALATVIKRLVGDADERVRLGVEAAARVREQNTWQANALRYSEVYRRARIV